MWFHGFFFLLWWCSGGVRWLVVLVVAGDRGCGGYADEDGEFGSVTWWFCLGFGALNWYR